MTHSCVCVLCCSMYVSVCETEGRGGEGGEREEREAVGVLMDCWLQTLCAYKSEMLMAQLFAYDLHTPFCILWPISR